MPKPCTTRFASPPPNPEGAHVAGGADAQGRRVDRRHRRSTARRYGRSRQSRSSCYRTSPRRPSSPSRTRGCSTSCASAPTIFPRHWSSRRRPGGAQGHLKLAGRAGAGVPGHAGERNAHLRGASSAFCGSARRTRFEPARCTTRRREFAEFWTHGPRAPTPGSALARLVKTSKRFKSPISKRSRLCGARRPWSPAVELAGIRSFLVMPMLKEGRADRSHRHLSAGSTALH